MPNIEFLQPKTVEEAVSLLASRQGSRCVAGGQTLVAMMNAGLVAAASLISIEGISELRSVEEKDGSIRIGAGVTHRDVASYGGFLGANQIIREAAGVIAHPAIRNFGTMGGSLAHGDPASDYPTAAVAANATVEIANLQRRRTVAASDFFLDYLTTALEEGEMVTALILPRAPVGSAGHYLKFSRVDGDYAIISIGVTLTRRDDGVCTQARLAAGGLGPKPLWCAESDAALCDTRCDDAAVNRAARHLLDLADPVDDVRASADYRRALLPKLLRRAVCNIVSHQSAERADG
jgi:aerobic carbon-monoxide dehydrogenase medium subunit